MNIMRLNCAHYTQEVSPQGSQLQAKARLLHMFWRLCNDALLGCCLWEFA
jgi:hypothetical protein